MIPLEQEPAFALHRKPYKENNYLIDIFSLNFVLFVLALVSNKKKRTEKQTTTLLFSYSKFQDNARANSPVYGRPKFNTTLLPAPRDYYTHTT